MRAAVTWGAGLALSVVAHAGMAAVLLWAIQPEPVQDQPVPETRMQLSAYQVERSEARPAEPQAETAQAGETTGNTLSQGAIPQSRAEPLATPADVVESALPEIAPTSLETSATLATVASPVASGATQVVAPTAPASAPLPPAESTAQLVTASVVPSEPLGAGAPDAQQVAYQAPPAQTLDGATPSATPIVQAVPNVTRAKAALAFDADSDGPVDPVSLAAFQSFTAPEDAGTQATDLRDGIEGLLAQVPCARMQVQFQPATNTLQVVGHIPEDGLRAPVLAALQAQMGSNITVADNLLILPRPQCGALGGIAGVGLPQSTDQITNPLLVGDDTHAREFRYVEGQQLVLDLTAPDYDAYVYVDYFDAQGQVIHLSPNDSTPLTRSKAKSAFRVGAASPGDPGLYITIGPPYGQEIAVAFAASKPLYDDARPLVEPAAPYLVWMKEQVARARRDDPGFKGEWVYFFVATSAR